MRVFEIMGDHPLRRSECHHTLGTFESIRQKVTTLPSPKRLRAGRSNSFSPDHLSPFPKVVFSYGDTVSEEEGAFKVTEEFEVRLEY
jgi:hypothetical protein